MKWNFRTNFECWQEVCGLKLTFNLSGNSGLSHPVIGFSRANSVFIGILPDEYRMLSRKPDKRMWQTGFDNPDFFFLISSDILWFHSFINSSQKCRKTDSNLYFLFSFTRTTVSGTWWVFNTGKGVWSFGINFSTSSKNIMCTEYIGTLYCRRNMSVEIFLRRLKYWKRVCGAYYGKFIWRM